MISRTHGSTAGPIVFYDYATGGLSGTYTVTGSRDNSQQQGWTQTSRSGVVVATRNIEVGAAGFGRYQVYHSSADADGVIFIEEKQLRWYQSATPNWEAHYTSDRTTFERVLQYTDYQNLPDLYQFDEGGVGGAAHSGPGLFLPGVTPSSSSFSETFTVTSKNRKIAN